MLTTLRIKNLALAADVTIELHPGFNAITGETGAGKSMLIGALNLALGERADRSLIRTGAESCSVEAVFDVGALGPGLGTFLEENGLEPCEASQLVVKRTLTAAGANRQFVNGSPTTLQVLVSLGQSLIDIHGPHDHQSLLHPNRQLLILDAFGGLQESREAFGKLCRQRTALEAEKTALIVDEKTYAQQLDLLRHQVTEITAAKLRPDEEAETEAEYKRAGNAARLLQLTQLALGVLGEDEGSLLTQAGLLGKNLLELQKIDGQASNFVALHGQAVALFADLQSELMNYGEQVEIDPARLEEIEERLNLLQSLKRKYGSTLAEVAAFGAEAAQRLETLERRDAELERLNAEIGQTETRIWALGHDLSFARKKVIPKLAKAVAKQLHDLGFKQSLFEIGLTSAEPGPKPPSFSSSGLDTVEFQFAPNPGEPAKPLRSIASSGEMARVMLALKTVLAAEDEIPVLVFDEVDANVGGETALAVGEKMKEIGRQRQVLCITHLAPVAASAASHYVVSKDTTAGRTFSTIHFLEGPERVRELARMLGGQNEAARAHAEALLKA